MGITIAVSTALFLLLFAHLASSDEFEFVEFEGIEFDGVNCFDYYRFGDVKFTNLYPAKTTYSPGDTVKVFYDIRNDFGSPVVEGMIKVLVLYIGLEDVDRVEGDDIIDEFYVIEDINLNTDDVYKGRFEWKIPKNAKPGHYTFNTYFLVKDKFNMAGLSFMTSIPAAMTIFEVENPYGHESILFDKNNTFVNDRKYLFRASIPSFEPEDVITIRTNLVNEGRYKEVNLTYELHLWDSYNQDSKIDRFTRHETKSLGVGPNSIEYKLSNIEPGVYMAIISSEYQDLQAILKIRFFVPGSNGKIVYLGLGHFPVIEGDKTSIVMCYQNSAARPGDSEKAFVGKGTIKLTDYDGSIIFEEKYGPVNATPNIKAVKEEFISKQTIMRAVLYANLYDESGVPMDEVEVEYDYSKFLNTEKNIELKIQKSKLSINGRLDYVVEYRNDMGGYADGNVVMYLKNFDGEVVKIKESSIHGTLKDNLDMIGLEKGDYTLKVVEKNEHLSDEKKVVLGGRVNYLKYVLVGLFVLAVLISAYFWRRRK